MGFLARERFCDMDAQPNSVGRLAHLTDDEILDRFDRILKSVFHYSEQWSFRSRCSRLPSKESIDIYGTEEDDPSGDEEFKRVFDRFEEKSKAITEDVNLGTPEEPKITKVSASLSSQEKQESTEFLKRNVQIFAWSYEDMLGLDPALVEHRLHS